MEQNNKPKRLTSSKTVTIRAGIVLGIATYLFALIFAISIYAGWESGKIQKDIIAPVKKSAESFIKALEYKPEPTPVRQKTPTPSLSSQRINIQNKIEINNETRIQQRGGVYPTYQPYNYAFPTPKPGEPGSKEWYDEFNRKWSEFNNRPTPVPGSIGSKEWQEEFDRKQAEMQKAFEEQKRKVCEQSPSLCNQ